MGFNDWNSIVSKIENEAVFSGRSYAFPGTVFGKWIPRASNSHLEIFAGISSAEMKDKNADVAVYAVLDDKMATRTDKYENEWNGFWHFYNVMQFDPLFIGVSQGGMEQMTYLALNSTTATDTRPDLTAAQADPWAEVIDLLFDEEAKALAEKLKNFGVEPCEVGYELADNSGEVLATIELAWPNLKVGYLTAEQREDKVKLEAHGWSIIDNIETVDPNMFGGVTNE